MKSEAPRAVPVIMGIVNVTPDSFSDGGQFADAEEAAAHALRLVEEGAHVLDIGGESTRPGSDTVPVEVELARVIPVIEKLKGRLPEGVQLAIDTRKPAVAEAAIGAGAHIWNDVSALTYGPDSLALAAKLCVPVVLMHAKGDPKTMQEAPRYGDVVAEVYGYLEERIAACEEVGIPRSHLIADPGIGFGKSVEHNTMLLKHMSVFTDLGVPVMLAASRKRFIAALDRDDGPADTRLAGSLAAAIAGWHAGASWFRVHDVAATRQALAVTRAVTGAHES